MSQRNPEVMWKCTVKHLNAVYSFLCSLSRKYSPMLTKRFIDIYLKNRRSWPLLCWNARLRCIFTVKSKYLDQLVRISGACCNHAPFKLIYIFCIFIRAVSCFVVLPDAQRVFPFFFQPPEKLVYNRENTSKHPLFIQGSSVPNAAYLMPVSFLCMTIFSVSHIEAVVLYLPCNNKAPRGWPWPY